MLDEQDQTMTHCVYDGNRRHYTAPTSYFQNILLNPDEITIPRLSGFLQPFIAKLPDMERAVLANALITQLIPLIKQHAYDDQDCNYYVITDDITAN